MSRPSAKRRIRPSAILNATKETRRLLLTLPASTFSPSWGDEFLTPLQTTLATANAKKITDILQPLTISTLEKINEAKFKIA